MWENSTANAKLLKVRINASRQGRPNATIGPVSALGVRRRHAPRCLCKVVHARPPFLIAGLVAEPYPLERTSRNTDASDEEVYKVSGGSVKNCGDAIKAGMCQLPDARKLCPVTCERSSEQPRAVRSMAARELATAAKLEEHYAGMAAELDVLLRTNGSTSVQGGPVDEAIIDHSRRQAGATEPAWSSLQLWSPDMVQHCGLNTMSFSIVA